MLGYSREEYKLFHEHAWRYLILFSVLYCCLYCTRLNLSNASASIISILHVSKSDIGILTGSLFWAYGLGQLINGRLSEIFGQQKFIVGSVLLSAAANALMPMQRSIVAMSIVWGLNGYFQSMAWTPGVSVITRWWPGNTRGFATGLAHAFSGFGQVISILAVAFSLSVMPESELSAVFLIPALFPLLALLLYLFCSCSSPSHIGLRDYTDSSDLSEAERKMRVLSARNGKLYPYKYVLSNKKFILWLAIAFITGLTRYGLMTWVPLYFTDKFGVGITEGLLGSISLPLGMGIGTFIVPWLTDRFCPRNRLPAVMFSSILGAFAVGVFPLMNPLLTVDMYITHALLFVAGFSIYAINGTAWAYATDIGGRVFSATSSGVLNFSAYLGAAAQSFIYGYLLDRIGWISVFASLSILCLLMAAIGFLGRTRKDKKGQEMTRKDNK